jgi:hypothetical protein
MFKARLSSRNRIQDRRGLKYRIHPIDLSSSIPLNLKIACQDLGLILDPDHDFTERRTIMAGSTYKIIELVGTSDTSWEEAAKTAVETAGESLKDLRIAEVTKLDVVIQNGKVTSYRARLDVSFKYHKED